jgi:hypothetical protein
VVVFPTSPALGQLGGGFRLRHRQQHRQHARVTDRIRETKATGLPNLPCHRTRRERRMGWKSSWRQRILEAWTKLIRFTDHPDVATCEIAVFHYRVLPVAAHITRAAR